MCIRDRRKGIIECDTFEALIFLRVNIMHCNLHDFVLSNINQGAAPEEDNEAIDVEECEEGRSENE